LFLPFEPGRFWFLYISKNFETWFLTELHSSKLSYQGALSSWTNC
jgi:hypothetical protein